MKVDHVAIAVWDLGRALDLWQKLLGGRFKQGVANLRGVTAVQLDYAAGSRIELITPSADPHGFLKDFLHKRGEGMHHVTFITMDLHGAVGNLKRAGYRVVSEDYSDPHWSEAFLSPSSTHGVLIQIAQSDLSQGQQDTYFGTDLHRVLEAARRVRDL